MELVGQPMHPPHHIYGIDFSGTKDAGKKIVIAKGIVKGETLLMEIVKTDLEWTEFKPNGIRKAFHGASY